MLIRVDIAGALVPLERSGSSECVDDELIVVAPFLDCERRQSVKRPPATARAIAVVPSAMPTITPVVIEVFGESIAAAVCEEQTEPVEDGGAISGGEAVTVLVTAAFTRSKEEELASPRVDESFCFTQPSEMKYLCPRIRPVA
jgi:hypothetical protein